MPRYVRAVSLTLAVCLVPSSLRLSAAEAAIPSASVASCPRAAGCTILVVRLINHERSSVGLPPLVLSRVQSRGRGSCVGSMGHTLAMAQTGSIWHTNLAFPRASFPHNICLALGPVGQNTGEMMSEPHDRAACAGLPNHACNILSPLFRYVGIGIEFAHGSTWLTEDFVGRRHT
jgi:hypothetical protein